MAAMLRHLPRKEEIVSLMLTRDFDLKYLRPCLRAGRENRRDGGRGGGGSARCGWSKLYEAGVEATGVHAKNMMEMTPHRHVALPVLALINEWVKKPRPSTGATSTTHSSTASKRFSSSFLAPEDKEAKRAWTDLFQDANWTDALLDLSGAFSEYLREWRSRPGAAASLSATHLLNDSSTSSPSSSPLEAAGVVRFVVMTMEFLHWALRHRVSLSVDQLTSPLHGLSSLLGVAELVRVLEQPAPASASSSSSSTPAISLAAHSLVLCVYQVVQSYFLLPGEKRVDLPAPAFVENSLDDHAAAATTTTMASTSSAYAFVAWETCRRLAETFVICRSDEFGRRVSARVGEALRDCVIGLCRVSPFNAYVRVPPLLWKMGWNPFSGGDLKISYS